MPIWNRPGKQLKKMPEVSVIVPNYNHAPYLRQRLDSIFNQTFQDFEVILLDDASTDNSVEILQEYATKYQDKVSHYKVNSENSGSPFRQWKKGIDLAKGEYIWIAESDDFSERLFLERTIEIFNENETATIVVTDSKYVHNSQIINLSPPFDRNNLLIRIAPRHLLSKCPIRNVSAVVMRRKIIGEEKYYSYKYIGDKLFYYYFFRNKEIYYLQLPLNYYRRHSQNVSIEKNINTEIERYEENYKLTKLISYEIKGDSFEVRKKLSQIQKKIINRLGYKKLLFNRKALLLWTKLYIHRQSLFLTGFFHEN